MCVEASRGFESGIVSLKSTKSCHLLGEHNREKWTNFVEKGVSRGKCRSLEGGEGKARVALCLMEGDESFGNKCSGREWRINKSSEGRYIIEPFPDADASADGVGLGETILVSPRPRTSHSFHAPKRTKLNYTCSKPYFEE